MLVAPALPFVAGWTAGSFVLHNRPLGRLPTELRTTGVVNVPKPGLERTTCVRADPERIPRPWFNKWVESVTAADRTALRLLLPSKLSTNPNTSTRKTDPTEFLANERHDQGWDAAAALLREPVKNRPRLGVVNDDRDLHVLSSE